jgi:mannose-6-phosphate isomerase-like protein (cupin superfamily)
MDSLIGLELDNGAIHLKFVATAAETSGALHAQEARYAPKSPLPPYHCHPSQDERFILEEGRLRFVVDGQERLVQRGQTLDIPRGAFHHAHNPYDAPALVRWETRPAMRSAEMYRALYRLARFDQKAPILGAAVVLSEFKAEFQLARPPPFIAHLVFGCLGPIGRLAGYGKLLKP